MFGWRGLRRARWAVATPRGWGYDSDTGAANKGPGAMQLTGEVTITAAREAVWAALNDPDVLARCIEGVETLTRVASDAGDRFEGKMNAKVGPVRATFTGQVTLTDVVQPESYVLVGEGKGGVAGFRQGRGGGDARSRRRGGNPAAL